MREWNRFHFDRLYSIDVLITPKPYITLRWNRMEDASGKYRVGHEISPKRAPNTTACARIWLSKTKSSELRSSGNDSSSSLLNARKPVWYSDKCAPRTKF